MKKLFLAILAIYTLAASPAGAQCNGNFPANTACGTVAGGIPKPIPFSSIVPARTPLTGNLTVWVRQLGNDIACTGLSNTNYVSGTFPQACAKATWNNAYSTVATTYDFEGYTVTIKSGTTNTYTAGLFATTSLVGGGSLVIDLNGSSIAETATKGIINDAQLGGFLIQNSAGLGVGGVVSSLNFSCIQNDVGGVAIGTGITTGPCAGAHYEATQAGAIYFTAPINIAGATSRQLFSTAFTGFIATNGVQVNFTSTINFSTATISSVFSSGVDVVGTTFNLGAFTVTGLRWALSENSYLSTGGATIPGTALTGTLDSSSCVDSNCGMFGGLTVGKQGGTSGSVTFNGTTSGATQVTAPAAASGVQTLPTGSGTILLDSSTATVTNKTFNCTNNTCTVRIASDVTGLGTGVATALGVNIGSAGAAVLFNGAGGTPSSMVATNLTGTAAALNIGGNAATASAVAVGGITGAGTGCITFLTTPSSANLRGCVNDETGTGLAYFQGGDIGTPSAGVGTNLTALNATNLANGTVNAARLGFAAKTDMQTPTSTTLIVNPRDVQDHPGVAKYWARLDGKTGATCAIAASYNITSCSRTGTGAYTINFTTNFANTNYTLSGSAHDTGVDVGIIQPSGTFAVGSVNFLCVARATGVAQDCDIMSIEGFGAQ